MRTVTINIVGDVHDDDGAAELAEHIAEQIREGFTSGYYPTWSITDDREN